ncbi:Plastidal glycolate/glycerate translocator 1 like protein [Verticillium longisporum]|uniref:Plastidal glycolate/glycerate translocator 1 like protein n=1 Tax=Verticillium longisporum TaxID=100787 RepID=A0A8I2ZYE7_VERLO|nr:Plastidal glycolate/glycerate translocator 1 like protein [Verticillium longisporum]
MVQSAPRDKAGRAMTQLREGVSDGLGALKLTLSTTAPKLLVSWLYVPSGIMVTLAFCFAVHVGLRAAGVSFPSSVACLVLLFAVLLLSEMVLGARKTKLVVDLIDVPAGWSLRWINVMFTPSFILLPLSPAIGIMEVLKIIAVFLLGFLAMMALAAYLTRGIQLVTGSSKRAIAERAEEMGNETDEIPLAATPRGEESSSAPTSAPISAVPSSVSLNTLAPLPPSRNASHVFLSDTLRSGGHHLNETSALNVPPSLPPQVPLPHPRTQIWAAWLTHHSDHLTYGALFLFAGIPLYYSSVYAMPLQLSVTILAYFAALAIPLSWRQYIHPVLVTALISVLTLWALAGGGPLSKALAPYRTGATYLRLWSGDATSTLPGAGDMLATALDASIVSLALPMYQYRRELRAHFLAIVLPNLVLAVASLFCYPVVCFAIGIEARRALAFASRSLTLALAIPATENLGGDVNAVAALAIFSGIAGVLIGERMLRWMRIPEDDYVTRGVTLGANSSAIATAVLLRTDPRAAALSSLSMSLFGTMTVLLTSIPPIAGVVRSLVSL